MADVIDLTAERNRREAPDPDLIRKDQWGRDMFLFLLSYDMADSQWTTEVWAYDFDDAAARVAAMRQTLRVDGRAYTRLPA